MKVKFLFLMAGAAALTTACSSEDAIDINPGNAIEFSVVSSKTPRAIATSTNSIKEFKVYAFTQGATYMNGVEVTKNSESKKWEYSPLKFWPETAIDFFSVSPKSHAITFAETDGVRTGTMAYTITDGNEDLLYAVNMGALKANPEVGVNFRHALSQIEFQVKNINTGGIKVKVAGIKVDGVANASTLTWAKASTGSNLSAGSSDTETGDTWGKWATATGAALNNSFTAFEVVADNAVEITNDPKRLFTKNGENENYKNNSRLFLMPQILKPWLTFTTTGEGDKAVTTTTVTGTSRILVNCHIEDATTGIQLWPKVAEGATDTPAYGWVAVNLTNPTNDPNKTEKDNHERWMQGKKYIYTLIFGKGAGFDPEKPEPVLVPISFTVTVDTFQNGGSYDASGETK